MGAFPKVFGGHYRVIPTANETKPEANMPADGSHSFPSPRTSLPRSAGAAQARAGALTKRPETDDRAPFISAGSAMQNVLGRLKEGGICE